MRDSIVVLVGKASSIDGQIGKQSMIEVMIERWTNPDGSTDHLWSLWRDGSRLHFGDKHETAFAAEAEAMAFCQRTLGVEPDRVTRL